MKHRNSHLLFGYWSRLRNGRDLPDQTDIDPRAIKRILSYVFILEASDADQPLYRLAGTSHCDRYGVELKGTSFLARWEGQSRNALGLLLRQSLQTRQPVCLSSLAASDECGMLEVETVLAPLTFGGGRPARFVGLSQVLGDASVLAGRPITFERLVSSKFLHESEPLTPPGAPPPATPVLRSHAKAPHLRLVISQDRPATAPPTEIDTMMKRIIDALEIVPGRNIRAVS
ncbi:MAG: PAS domain-containing protein [Alphaproteobacteria bacterium]|nr:PAS domain-containing protein [Alphaproteobacteria bacterium]